MLSDYRIENVATRIPDKANDITEIQTPFVAQFSGDFVAIYKVDSNNVSFLWQNVNHVLPIAKYIESWTGIVLLAESCEKSGEPDYQKHRKTVCINLLKKVAFFSACSLILLICVLNHVYAISINQLFRYSTILLFNFAGLYTSWLLLLKQMHAESKYADKICSLFKQSDCNNVLESDAAKLFGIVGWSEIGFGYFLTNIILLLLFPTLLTTIALLNVLTLPFTVWSIWYQRTKAKQLCMLCVIVVVLLWAIFFINCLFGYIQISHPPIEVVERGLYTQYIIVAYCYFTLILGTNLLVPNLNSNKTINSLHQTINSLKANEDVFTNILKKQPYYETNKCASVIRFGNPNSKLQVTILSNPYCTPCAKMHHRIEELLQQVNNEISIQYILSSFGENFNSTNKLLIAVCLDTKVNSTIQVFSEWFEKGKALKDGFFKSFSLNLENPEIETEFLKHDEWKQKNQIRSTPFVLVNGYKLPDIYKIDDLRYFTNLDLRF